MNIRPLHPVFAAEVTGIDLRQPVSDAQLRVLEQAIDHHGVLVFRDQPLTDAQQMAFSQRFGPLETSVSGGARLNQPLLSDISNLGDNNELRADDDDRRMYGLANMLWHTDSSFKQVPAKYSLLSAHVLPAAGGNTEFADLRDAFDRLPADTRQRIEGRFACHALEHSRASIGFELPRDIGAQVKPAWHPLVQAHASGRTTLYLASHAYRISGMPVPDARILLMQLIEHATPRERIYSHSWRPHDLVMWDNRCTLHRATPIPAGLKRDMRRSTVSSGVAPDLSRLDALESAAFVG